MNIKVLPVLTAGTLIAGTAVPAFAIPAALPIDYRTGVSGYTVATPLNSAATGLIGLGPFPTFVPIIGPATVTQDGEGLGVNSPFPPDPAGIEDPGEVGGLETLTLTINTTVTGAWLLQLFQERVIDEGSVQLYGNGGVPIGVPIPFNGTGNPTSGNGEEFIDFGGAIYVESARFSAPGTFLQGKDYSVAGFVTAPDGGTTVLLLGSAVSALGLIRRRFLS